MTASRSRFSGNTQRPNDVSNKNFKSIRSVPAPERLRADLDRVLDGTRGAGAPGLAPYSDRKSVV